MYLPNDESLASFSLKINRIEEKWTKIRSEINNLESEIKGLKQRTSNQDPVPVLPISAINLLSHLDRIAKDGDTVVKQNSV